jgi:hypothetical protein
MVEILLLLLLDNRDYLAVAQVLEQVTLTKQEQLAAPEFS